MLLTWLTELKRGLRGNRRRRRKTRSRRLPSVSEVLEERILLSGHSLDGDPPTQTVAFKDGFTNSLLAASYTGTEDTMILSNSGGERDQNFGARTDMEVGEAPGGSFPRHGLMRFDVSSLSGEYSTIESATLRLFPRFLDVTSSDALQVYRVADSNAGWVEGTEAGVAGADPADNGMSTYNQRVQGAENWTGSAGASTAGTDYTDLLGTAAFDAATGTGAGNSFDVVLDPALVQDLIDDWTTGTNAGLFLRSGSELDNLISFHSADASDPALRPELIVEYSTGPLVYFNDFETNTDGFNSASRSTLTDSSGSGTSAYLGRFADSTAVTLTLSDLTPGATYDLAFDLYTGASWDGSPTGFGPDRWQLVVDGTTLIDTTFGNIAGGNRPQDYSDENPTGPGDNPSGAGADVPGSSLNIYSFSRGAGNPQLSFTATDTTTSVTFQGVGLQGVGDEFWAIDNVAVSAPILSAAGTALSFDGVNDFVSASGTFGGGPEATIEAWVKTAGITGDFQAVVSSSGAQFARLQLHDAGNIAVYTDSGAFVLPIVSPTPTGEWRHIALSIKSGDTRLFVDGILVGTSTHAFSSIIATSNLRIGSGFADGRLFNGQIDEVRIWTTARTETEIGADKNRALTGTEQGLAGYWRFNEGQGDTAVDVSGNGNHGTLGNGVATQEPEWVDSTAPIIAAATRQLLSAGKPVTGSGFFDAGSIFAFDNVTDGRINDTSYWLTRNFQVDDFTVDLEDEFPIDHFRLQNTHNQSFNDRGTRDFRIQLSTDGVNFTTVIDDTLADVSGAEFPFETFNLTQPVTARYVRFLVDSFRGFGGGLNEIEVYGFATPEQLVAPDLVVEELTVTLSDSGDVLRIGGWDASRGGGQSLRDAVGTGRRDQIEAAFPGAIITATDTLTADYLATVDVVYLETIVDSLNGITPLTADEQTALLNFTLAGGTAILVTDHESFAGAGTDAINESLIDPFGLDTRGVVIGNSRPVTVTDPSAHPVTDGPFGRISGYGVSFAGFFDNLGANAQPLATLDENGEVVLAVIDPGVLGPASGLVLLFSDGVIDFDLALNAIHFGRQSAAPSGQQLVINWNTANRGDADATGGWTEQVYVENLTTDTVIVDMQIDVTTDLAPGEFESREVIVAIPGAGEYLVRVTTDAGEQVFEFNVNGQAAAEANNTSETTFDVAGPDLVVSSVIGPVETVVGNPAEVELTWTVENRGPTGVVTSQIGTVAADGSSGADPLETGDSYTQSREVMLPAGIDGDFYIFVRANVGGRTDFVNSRNDSSRGYYQTNLFENAGNNRSVTDIPVTYREPDLIVSEVLIPASAGSGELMPVTFTVENIGTRATRQGFWIDSVYFSLDPSLDENDQYLAEVRRFGGLAANASYETSVNVRLPYGIDGEFYILVVADSNLAGGSPPSGPGIRFQFQIDRQMARVPEFQDEGNNLTSRPLTVEARPAADLQVTMLTAPDRVTAGQSFDVTHTVTNTGNGPTPTEQNRWDELIYLSRDEFLDLRADRYLTFESHVGVLDPGESYTITRTLRAPNNLDGPFHVVVVTDPQRNSAQGNVFEGANEANNATAFSPPTIFELPPPSDLQVTSITVPGGGRSGESIDVSWVVTNADTQTAAVGTWTDAVYLSSDAIWDIDDRLLGRVEVSRPNGLGPGVNYISNLLAALPPAKPGSYHIIVRPDIFSEVFEAENEANNRTASADTLAVQVDELQLGVPLDTTLDAGQTRLYQVDVAAGQTLRVSITSNAQSSANELFVRFGDVPTGTQFDAAYERPLGPDQSVLLPTTQPGTYFVLVRGHSEPFDDTPVTLLAETLPFEILDVLPDVGGDSRYVTMTITGAQIHPQALVKLVRPGFAEFEPVNYQVIDSTKIIAIFDLTDAPRA